MAYAAIPFAALFGPNLLDVRIPAALIGTVTALLTILVGRHLSKRWSVGLLAGFILAVSPWHLLLSRTGHEVVWSPFLFLLGFLAFLRAVDRKLPLGLFLAAGAWALLLYGYPIAKLFLPLMLIFIGMLWRKELWAMRRWTLLATGAGLLLLVPEFYLFFTRFGDVGRLKQISIFTNQQGPWLGQLVRNFIAYIDPEVWVTARLTTGPLEWLAVILGLPFFFLLTKRGKSNFPRWFAAAWLLIAVLPSLLGDINPHQLRAAFLIGPMHILVAWGLILIAEPFSKRFRLITKRLVVGVVLASCVIGIWAFWQPSLITNTGFYKAQINFTPEAKQVVQTLSSQFQNAPEVWIQDVDLNQMQVFFMLFEPMDPQVVQHEHVIETDKKGWYRTVRLGRYHFCAYDDCPIKRQGVIFLELAYRSNLGKHELARIPIHDPVRPNLAWIISGN
jgi:4-amino-4-deoxy-L-arabinose transferase-like glycosyltransferase